MWNTTQLLDNMYTEQGYLNMGAVIDSPFPFIFVLGPRGTGKTYGAIDYCIDNEKTFILLRRTQTQIDIVSKEEFSPVKPNMVERGCYFKRASLCKQVSANYFADADGEIIDNNPFFYTAALSTFSNLRGFSLEDAKIIIADEIIGEPTEREIRNEYMAFCNCYETVNRNRELKGAEPLKFVGLANSFNLANPIFIGLQIVNDVFDMLNNGEQVFADEERGLLVVCPSRTPISEKKADTALYRLSRGSEYAEMALNNKFVYDVPENIGKRPINEYKRIVKIGEITVCRHKSNGTYYVTTDRRCGTASYEYTTSDNDVIRCRMAHGVLYVRHMQHRVFFENYVSQVLFEKFFCKNS